VKSPIVRTFTAKTIAMEISILLAKFWGLYCLILCLILLLRPDVLRSLFSYNIDDPHFMLLTGFMAFSMGLANILLHNIWTADWRVVITLMGWMALLKGIMRIGFPSASARSIQTLQHGKYTVFISGTLGAILGAWLTWVGFTA
jgi:hypothetical protein